ncbi:MAG: PQQ-binding-like beta-propeller repeat protein [bacterium]
MDDYFNNDSASSVTKLTILLLVVLSALSCRTIKIPPALNKLATDENWLQYGGAPARSNYYEKTIAPPLKTVWTYKASSAVNPTLVVADGVVYFGTMDGRFEAVRVATGEKIGRKNSEGHYDATLAYYDGNLFLASRYGDKTLAKYHLATGNFLWKIDAGDIASEPLVTAGGIYISALYNHIDKYDLNSGERIWTFKTADQHRSSPALSRNVLVVGCDNGVLYALDAQTGELNWEIKTAASIFATPVIQDEVIFVSSVDSNFYALDLIDGLVKWQFDAQTPLYQTAATDGKVVLFGASDGRFYCLDVESGEKKWQFQVSHAISTAPVIAGDVVYFGSLDKNYYCLNLQTGQKIWQQETRGRIRTSPVIWKNYVFGASEDKFVYAFRQADSGKRINSTRVENYLYDDH